MGHHLWHSGWVDEEGLYRRMQVKGMVGHSVLEKRSQSARLRLKPQPHARTPNVGLLPPPLV